MSIIDNIIGFFIIPFFQAFASKVLELVWPYKRNCLPRSGDIPLPHMLVLISNLHGTQWSTIAKFDESGLCKMKFHDVDHHQWELWCHIKTRSTAVFGFFGTCYLSCLSCNLIFVKGRHHVCGLVTLLFGYSMVLISISNIWFKKKGAALYKQTTWHML